MILKSWFILVLTATSCVGQRRCSYDRMRQCQDGLRRNTDKRITDMNRQDITAHCTNTQDDFNCFLKETRCLSDSERQRNSGTLRSALRYIKEECSMHGGSWKDNSCFVGDGIKNCENSNPLGSSSFSFYTPDSCRKYQQFHECVNDVVRNRCHFEDERLIGQYLMDMAQDLAWNCSESDIVSDRDSGRYGGSSDRYGGSDRDRYGGSYDRNGGSDRDRYSGSDRDRYGGSDRDRYGGSSDRYGGSSDRDRYGGSANRNYDRGSDRGYDRYDRNYQSYGNGSFSGGPNSSRNSGPPNTERGADDITCCRRERCERSRLQQCRDSLSRTIDNGMSGYQDIQKCRKARDDFNCLLWQNSCLNPDEKNRNTDLFHRAKDYFTKSCDTYARWNENSCYKSPDMQRCESYLSNTRGSDYEACRSYNNFRECVSNELRNRCTREDELLQGEYLTDKAKEMSWTCSRDRMNDGNGYSSGDRRNPYDRRNDNYSPYGSSNDDYPPHLDDDDIECQRRVQPQADNCESTLRETRRQLITESNYDIKQKRTCCSAREFQSCLRSAIQRVCQQYRRRVVESLMGRQQYELSSSACQNIYENDCSSSTALVAIFIHVFISVFFTSFIRYL